jgi:hypothetical protein
MSEQGRPTQGRLKPGQARSSGAIQQRRVPRAWPADRRFRILSIDGGGIRGIFPAAVLAGLERAYTSGNPIASYFDLVAGTSTGGIIALGLGAGLGADQLLDLYVRRGGEVFPPVDHIGSCIRRIRRIARYRYDTAALRKLLEQTLGDKLFGDSCVPLCIPAFEGHYSEVFVFKRRTIPTIRPIARSLWSMSVSPQRPRRPISARSIMAAIDWSTVGSGPTTR